jgi:thioredoxin 2
MSTTEQTVELDGRGLVCTCPLVAKVNTEELADLAGRFGICSIPTLALFKAGREMARQAGAMPAPAILQFLQPAL